MACLGLMYAYLLGYHSSADPILNPQTAAAKCANLTCNISLLHYLLYLQVVLSILLVLYFSTQSLATPGFSSNSTD